MIRGPGEEGGMCAWDREGVIHIAGCRPLCRSVYVALPFSWHVCGNLQPCPPACAAVKGLQMSCEDFSRSSPIAGPAARTQLLLTDVYRGVDGTAFGLGASRLPGRPVGTMLCAWCRPQRCRGGCHPEERPAHHAPQRWPRGARHLPGIGERQERLVRQASEGEQGRKQSRAWVVDVCW